MTGKIAGHLERTRCRVVLDEAGSGAEVWARLAVPPPYQPQPGDHVLVTGQAGAEAYIIGVLSAVPPAHPKLEARDGASASLREVDGCQTLELRDREDRLLFAYDTESGGAVLSVPEGDLLLASPKGKVRIMAGRGLELFSAGSARLSALEGVELAGGALEEQTGARMTLGRKLLSLTGPRLAVAAEEGDIALGAARYRGTALSARLDRVKLVAGRLETLAEKIVSRAKSLTERIEGLRQSHAGRVKIVARDSLDLRGRDAWLEGQDAVRLQGDKIHLG